MVENERIKINLASLNFKPLSASVPITDSNLSCACFPTPEIDCVGMIYSYHGNTSGLYLMTSGRRKPPPFIVYSLWHNAYPTCSLAVSSALIG